MPMITRSKRRIRRPLLLIWHWEQKETPKSEGSLSADNSGAGRTESFHQDLLPTQALKSSIISANRTDGDGQATAAEGSCEIAGQGAKGIFVGSAGSNKYHRPDCRFVAKIKNKSMIEEAEDAQKNGEVSCKTCNPP
jgi:hypothetical protein